MNLSEINNRITFLTNQDSNAFPAADRVVSINQAIDEIHLTILESMGGWNFDDVSIGNTSQWPKSYNLVAAQQAYDIDIVTNTIMSIDRVEVSYDGTNWYKAEPFNIGQRGLPIDSTSIGQDFTQAKPYYSLTGENLYLWPIPSASVTNGLKIWYERAMTRVTTATLSTGTAVPGFNLQFHDLIPLKVAVDWYSTKEPSNGSTLSMMTNKMLMLEDKMKKFYHNRIKDGNMALASAWIDYE